MKELFKAIKENNIEAVKLLLERGADINTKDKDGRTALMYAASAGCTETVKLLLDHGADINAKTKYGYRTALMLAAIGGHTETVKLLLERGADVNTIGEFDRPALMCAALEGHTEIVNLLLDHSADIHAKDKDGRTALMWAAHNGHTGIVNLLLDHGADIHAIDELDRTALMLAADGEHTEIATTLIELGADIPEDKTDIMITLEQAPWWTGSHAAVMNNRLDDIKNFGDQSSSITPLDLAIMIGNLEAVKHILERRANSPTLFSSSTVDMNDCLNKAIKAKRNDIAIFFLEKDADPTARNQLGQTSLHIACSYGNKDIIPILLERMSKGNTNQDYNF